MKQFLKQSWVIALLIVVIATTGATYKSLMVNSDDECSQAVEFLIFPVTPSSAPTLDYQVANKKLVADSINTLDSEKEDSLGNPTTDGDVLSSTIAGVRTWISISATDVEGSAILSTGETGGVKYLREDGDGTSSWQAISASGTFLTLTDTPSAYTGQAGKVATVNTGETALEFTTVSTGLDIDGLTAITAPAVDDAIPVYDESASANRKITVSDIRQDIPNAQTGTTYTTVLTDASKTIWISNASAQVVTIPTNASVAYPVNTVLVIVQEGAGQTTITGATGVTINGTSAGSVAISAQYGAIQLVKRSSDVWIAIGAIE